MAVQARISSPGDRDGITDLMRRAFGSGLSEASVDAGFQRWKYWDEHPIAGTGRSFVLNGRERIVGHACRWPLRILTAGGAFDAFHLIDWAADSSHAGSGLQVLLDSCESSAALFSIGGSPVTHRMLPAVGQHLRRRQGRAEALSYQVGGKVYFLSRPLRAMAAAFGESPLGWKTVARVAKNRIHATLPNAKLPAGVNFEPVLPLNIPPALWPAPTSEFAVTARTSELLQHFANCPVLKQAMCFVVAREGTPIAYFFLALAGTQLRIADYGPAGLDSQTAKWVGMAAQLAARRYYPDALRIAVATSETAVQPGLREAGFRDTYEEEIRGLIADPALIPVKQYRLTYLDLDALCL
jgi:hypothetical protein